MSRYRSIAVSCAAALVLAACAEPVTAPASSSQFAVVSDGSALSSIRSEGRASRFKFHQVRTAAASSNLTLSNATFSNATKSTSKTTVTPTLASGMIMHGGAVLQAKTNVFAIYWSGTPIFTSGPKTGTGTGTADGSLVGFFLRNLGGSPWFNVNTTYTTSAGTKIANVVNYTGYWANATSAPAAGTSVTDASILAMLTAGFKGGQLKYDSTTIYAVFTGPKVNLGGGAGSVYCGYHSAAKLSIGGVTHTVLYTAQPYANSWPSTCAATTVSANGDLGADVQVNILAHELTETVTDMLGTAWSDVNGFEEADKCAWNFGTPTATSASKNMKYTMSLGGKYFLVQTLWQNYSTGGCVIKF